jgi:hypothetical protein
VQGPEFKLQRCVCECVCVCVCLYVCVWSTKGSKYQRVSVVFLFIYLLIYSCIGGWTQGLYLEPLHQPLFFWWWVFSR